MAQIRGKQVTDGEITQAKLETTYEASLFLKTGARALTGNLDAGSQRITNLAAPTSATDAARLQDLYDRSVKQVVRAASTVNLTQSGPQTVDGVSCIAGDRVLCKDQTTASTNGIFVVAAGAWARASDCDSATELLGASCVVSEGATNGDKVFLCTADAPIVVATTALPWVQIGSQTPQAIGTSNNKAMICSVTAASGDLACATALASTPKGYVVPLVNGVEYSNGNAVKTSDFYFSSDSGATAKAHSAIASGDLCYRGSGLSFNLDANDRMSFDYDS